MHVFHVKCTDKVMCSCNEFAIMMVVVVCVVCVCGVVCVCSVCVCVCVCDGSVLCKQYGIAASNFHICNLVVVGEFRNRELFQICNSSEEVTFLFVTRKSLDLSC